MQTYATIDLRTVPTVVYTVDKEQTAVPHSLRRRRIAEQLSALGTVNWRFFWGALTSPYWPTIGAGHAQLLRDSPPPLLILEDDCRPHCLQPLQLYPAQADLLYLGGGRYGWPQGIKNARDHGIDCKWGKHWGWQHIDADWLRIFGMLYTHAILYLSKPVMLEVADFVDQSEEPLDAVLAREQWRWQTMCKRTPCWYQDDGHHAPITRGFAPKYL